MSGGGLRRLDSDDDETSGEPLEGATKRDGFSESESVGACRSAPSAAISASVVPDVDRSRRGTAADCVDDHRQIVVGPGVEQSARLAVRFDDRDCRTGAGAALRRQPPSRRRRRAATGCQRR